CGYNCHLCAARSENPAIRQKMVDGWRKIYGHEKYTAENVKCDGCLSDGKIADINCKARPCAREKGIKNCAYCDEFPCNKVKNLIASKDEMMVLGYPRTSSISEEEYNLCMKQFNSLSNLVNILINIGKLPSWLEKQNDL
ncbi:unnamed protein product, partial [marine sediment metagenome]